MSQSTGRQSPVNLMEHGVGVFPHLQNVEKWIAAAKLDQDFAHLLKLRASQINGCTYCVRMHSADARKGGESNQRLDELAVWRHSNAFSDAEKTALAWFEALTKLSADTDFGRLRAELRVHYDDEEIAAFTIVAGMINLWNRIQISNH